MRNYFLYIFLILIFAFNAQSKETTFNCSKSYKKFTGQHVVVLDFRKKTVKFEGNEYRHEQVTWSDNMVTFQDWDSHFSGPFRLDIKNGYLNKKYHCKVL